MEQKIDMIIQELAEMRKENSHSAIRIKRVENALLGDKEFKVIGLIDKVELQQQTLELHSKKHNDLDGQKKKAAGFLAAFSILLSVIIWGFKELYYYVTHGN